MTLRARHELLLREPQQHRLLGCDDIRDRLRTADQRDLADRRARPELGTRRALALHRALAGDDAPQVIVGRAFLDELRARWHELALELGEQLVAIALRQRAEQLAREPD